LTHRHEQAQSAIMKVFSNEDSAAAAPADPSGRRERAKAANREAILAAARRTFAELGYEASTVRDIIRRTDLASGTFYNYFRSKEEVYDALADDSARRFRPILRAAREQTEGFEDYLRLALRAYFQFLVDENRGGPNPVSDRRPNAHADTPEMMAVFAEVRESLDDAIARGLAPPVDSVFLAVSCIGIAQEVGAEMLTRKPQDIDSAVDFAASLILHGIAGAPRRA
jgi:AcrR family transcriptional regulator